MNGVDEEKDWLTLDNAAKIYPATTSHRSPAEFRISVTLNKPVRLIYLQNALEGVLPRFPYFQVYLRRGFFWYYLQRHSKIPKIMLLSRVPSVKFFALRKKTHLISISTKGNIIAADFSHIITDGKGGVTFLLSLVAEYCLRSGVSVDIKGILPVPGESPDPEEYEDAHRKHYIKTSRKPEDMAPAFHLPGIPKKYREMRVINARIPVDKLLEVTRSRGVTITEYLTALYLFCLIQIHRAQKGDGKNPRSSIIRLQVPVDMRRVYPSRTLRNFSLFVSPEIDLKLGEYTFEEVLLRVHRSMEFQLDKKELNRQLYRNVGGEFNPFVRVMPLFIKDRVLAWIKTRLGDRQYSGIISNLGRIDLPEELAQQIQSLQVTVHPSYVIKKSCGIISFKNDLYVTFSSLLEDHRVERWFFSHLAQNSIPVRVEACT